MNEKKKSKITRLHIGVVQESAESRTTTSSLILPKELPSVEEALTRLTVWWFIPSTGRSGWELS